MGNVTIEFRAILAAITQTDLALPDTEITNCGAVLKIFYIAKIYLLAGEILELDL